MSGTTMSRVCAWCAFVLAGVTLVGAGCYGLTRPDYDEGNGYGYPSDDKPPNVAQIVERHPELKGLVLTAPEYNAELELEAARKVKEGIPAVAPYIIQPGVSISIEILGEPEFTRTVIINIDGTFDYPLLGTIVARGLTLAELKSGLREGLTKYLKDPQIIVNAVGSGAYGVEQRIAAGKVLVLGRIATPGPHNYTGQEKLSGMIALAGWFTDQSERREVRILKPQKGHRRARIVISDFQQLIQAGDLAQDIPMEVDDIVYVPGHWTAGDQFSHDWDLTIRYLSGAQSLDGLLQYWGNRVNGRITGK
ncbi:MAG: polysaccharide biosynthesis/export family protein [Planctomycetota bacterium]